MRTMVTAKPTTIGKSWHCECWQSSRCRRSAHRRSVKCLMVSLHGTQERLTDNGLTDNATYRLVWSVCRCHNTVCLCVRYVRHSDRDVRELALGLLGIGSCAAMVGVAYHSAVQSAAADELAVDDADIGRAGPTTLTHLSHVF